MNINKYEYYFVWERPRSGPTIFLTNSPDTINEIEEYFLTHDSMDGEFLRNFREPSVIIYYLGDFSGNLTLPLYTINGEVIIPNDNDTLGVPRGSFRQLLMDSNGTIVRVVPDGVERVPDSFLLQIIASLDIWGELFLKQRDFLAGVAVRNGFTPRGFQEMRRDLFPGIIEPVLRPFRMD